MTGFGAGEAQTKDIRVSVEISSVNRKQSDIVINLPRDFNGLEGEIRQLVSAKVSRGRVVVQVTCERLRSAANEGLKIDHALASAYQDAVSKLGKELKMDLDLQASDLLRLPGIISVQEPSMDAAKAGPVIDKAVKKALTPFEAARREEGERLKTDLSERTTLLESTLASIEKEGSSITATYRKQLHRRLEEAGIAIALDDERLVKEIGMFAEKSDISEEVTRLHSHFVQMKKYLKARGPSGRSMDFLAQEMNREFNTIGSKANSATVAQLVVEGKTEVEKIREQVQNIE